MIRKEYIHRLDESWFLEGVFVKNMPVNYKGEIDLPDGASEADACTRPPRKSIERHRIKLRLQPLLYMELLIEWLDLVIHDICSSGLNSGWSKAVVASDLLCSIWGNATNFDPFFVGSNGAKEFSVHAMLDPDEK
eukprot:3913036-Amphidinium_carterae.1